MDTMRAVIIRQHGDLDALELAEMPIPQISAYEVLVKLRTASLNHLDIWVRKGIPGLEPPLPHIMGCDGAGEIAAVGDQVTSWKVGDEVMINPGISCGNCSFCEQGQHSLCIRFCVLGEHIAGTFAEYIAVPQQNIYAKPTSFSWQEAAAYPLVFVTAWRMLITRAQLKRGETILITGIGGGVATAALQIARSLSCKIAVTSSSDEKLAKAKQAGAELCLNYTRDKIANEIRQWTEKVGVAVVVDSTGGDSWRESIKCLAKFGRLVTCGATAGPNPATDIQRIFWNQLSILGSTMGNHQDFREVHQQAMTGALKPLIDSCYPLTRAKEAQSYMAEKRQFGKIVLDIVDSSQCG